MTFDIRFASTPAWRFLRIAVCLASALSATPSSGVEAQAFNLTITRQHSDSQCTSGYLAINGRQVGYTLEKPWRGNAPDISSIPPGTYAADLRYDKARDDHWTLQLRGVPGRSFVQLHVGNTTDDTTGCLLVGSALSSDLCGVSGSLTAIRAIKTAFYGNPNPIMSPDLKIQVTVVDDRMTLEGTWGESCSVIPGESVIVFSKTGSAYSGRLSKSGNTVLAGQSFTLSSLSVDQRTKRVTFTYAPPGYPQQNYACQLADNSLRCAIDAGGQTNSCTFARSR